MWSFLGSRQGLPSVFVSLKAPHEILTHSAFWKILIQPKPLHLERERIWGPERERGGSKVRKHTSGSCVSSRMQISESRSAGISGSPWQEVILSWTKAPRSGRAPMDSVRNPSQLFAVRDALRDSGSLFNSFKYKAPMRMSEVLWEFFAALWDQPA